MTLFFFYYWRANILILYYIRVKIGKDGIYKNKKTKKKRRKLPLTRSRLNTEIKMYIIFFCVIVLFIDA